MSKRLHMTRAISLALAVFMLAGLMPAAFTGFESINSKILTTEQKYIRLYVGESHELISWADHGGSVQESPRPYVPDGNPAIIEFNMDMTQNVRIELVSMDDEVLGVIDEGIAEGQRWYYEGGILVDHNPLLRGIANQAQWDGSYFDETVGRKMYPGDYDEDGMLIRAVYNFKIRFQPTDPNNAQYYIDMPIVIDYTDEGVLKNMQLVPFMNEDISPKCGDPVNMTNGNFIWEYTDFAVYGSLELEFSRHYNALDKRAGELGVGWRHNYMITLEENLFTAVVTMADGYRIVFNGASDGSFRAPSDIDMMLERTLQGGYVMTYRDMTKYFFDENGNLTALEEIGGDTTSLTYSGGKLTSVSNSTGTLSFVYTGDRITRITDHTGRSVYYT